jgi:hypothetical protein
MAILFVDEFEKGKPDQLLLGSPGKGFRDS